MTKPFSDEDYNTIFKVSKNNPDILVSRESSNLEFKESFSIDVLNRCMKTIAGFANNEGGYIVFGIKDKPHFLQGLSQKNEEKFDNLDPVKITENINNHFAPTVKIELQKYNFQGKKFGIIYVHEATSKPVICTRTEGENLRESAIYYRYRGQSREIRYSELREILDNIIERNNYIWQETFRKIGKIGVDNLAIINTTTGDLSVDSKNFFVDEELLANLNYVKEGHFVDNNGEPTLKLIGKLTTLDGKAPVISNTKIITKAGIRAYDIVTNFLTFSEIENPLDYITQICFELSAYLPIYYYISKSHLSIDDIIVHLDKEKSSIQTKNRLINRLKNPPNLSIINKKTYINTLHRRVRLYYIMKKAIEKPSALW